MSPKMQFIDRILRLGRKPRVLLFISGLFVVVNYLILSHCFVNTCFPVKPNLLLKRQNSIIFGFTGIKSQSTAKYTVQSIPTSTVSHQGDTHFKTSTDRSYYENENNNSTEEYEPFNVDFWKESSNFDTDTQTKIFKNNFTFKCPNVKVRRAQKRSKNFVVFENFITAKESMECHESITYTTHGDYRYLDNLIPLVDRFNGAVSVAIYSPGDDLLSALQIISFLRDCSLHKIKNLVTFHIFLDILHLPTPVNSSELTFEFLDTLYEEERWRNCEKKPNMALLRKRETYRIAKKLLYPVNIARNIARSAASTYFVLASDIELYPSVNLIPSFFEMLKEQSGNKIERVTVHKKQVYVLPIFEVKRNVSPPKTKDELLKLLETCDAVPFHNRICKECHLIPKYKEWLQITKLSTDALHVLHKAKRKGFWEPIFIGTKYEPQYDERLSWEGLRDKMTQGYILCALDYDFLILDNAFLVHRSGIKRISHKITKTVVRQDRLINLRIKAELFRKFGKHDGCSL